VNHRLGAFGYMNLTDMGAPPEFAAAGNSGTLDLVHALEWVRDNIEAFGGDPTNVTVFGQSGGGRKLSVLLSLDQARGLFHKALIQSGSGVIQPSREDMARTAQLLLNQLNTDWQGLLVASFESIIDAQSRMGSHAGGTLEFRPYVDGVIMQREPFAPDAPAVSAGVPLVIGYGSHDLSWKYADFNMDWRALQHRVTEIVAAEHAPRIIEAYREECPDLTPFLLHAAIATDQDLLYRVMTQADRKSAGSTAPVWVYRFDWHSPAFDGRFGATHGMDMALVFHNQHQPTIGGVRPEARILADKLASMLIALARTGSPATDRLPDWPNYRLSDRRTMLIDLPDQRLAPEPCRSQRLRLLWEEIGWGAAGSAGLSHSVR
jgi:para-nitrobenzyl esterase